MIGALNGIQEVIGRLPETSIVHLDCGGDERKSYQTTREFLSSLTTTEKILIAAIHDPATLGALKAIKEVGRTQKNTIVVGHDATREVRKELAKANSCLLGSVGFFPEKYGEQIIPLVLKILGGEAVPPMAYIEYKLITKENVESYYPATH